MSSDAGKSSTPKRIFVVGATGTIGRAAVRRLVAGGHDVICLVRPHSGSMTDLSGAEVRFGDVTDPASVLHDGVRAEQFDAVLSCLASRTGAPRDAWAVDYMANANTLAVAKSAGIGQMVLLSAICVQKPVLAFQHAKLAFESDLIASGLTYSIVRPTAFFKSLSGQVGRVRQGRAFLVFGDGKLTACKPISDDDLADYLVRCVESRDLQNKVLPIGGPGKAVTPFDQGMYLFKALGKKPRFRHVPIRFFDGIRGVLGALGRVSPKLAEKAELARIGRYYATESMLVLNPDTGLYDEAATPSTGSETLFDYYDKVIRGDAAVERGDHSVF